MDVNVLKVSSKSNPNSVAGALAGVLRERGVAELQAIGAGALNQAVKAVAIARGFVAPSGVDLVCIPRLYRHRNRWRRAHSHQIDCRAQIIPPSFVALPLHQREGFLLQRKQFFSKIFVYFWRKSPPGVEYNFGIRKFAFDKFLGRF